MLKNPAKHVSLITFLVLASVNHSNYITRHTDIVTVSNKSHCGAIINRLSHAVPLASPGSCSTFWRHRCDVIVQRVEVGES